MWCRKQEHNKIITKKIIDMDSPRMLLASLLFISFAFREHSCTGVRLSVPNTVKTGGNISLSCDYTLQEDQTLYTVKYFLGDKEFFRYTPSEDPSLHVFATLHVNRYQVHDEPDSLTLVGVNRDCTGVYKCEVTVEGPVFYTMIDTTYVTVTEEPENMPTIFTQNEGYQVGKIVTATCISRGGFPPANLTWFVDGAQLTYSDIGEVKQYTQHGDIDSSRSDLILPIIIQPASGILHLRCVASQFTLYNASSPDLLINEQSSSSSSIPMSFLTGCVDFGNIVTTMISAAVISLAHSMLQKL